VWAVRQHVLARMAAELHPHFDTLEKALHADPHARALMERCWLHLAGLPFITLAALPRPTPAVTPLAQSMARVVASIDAVLTQAEPLKRRVAPRPVVSPAKDAVTALRHQARHALIQGLSDHADQLLSDALTHDPRDGRTLADAAALALKRGDLQTAIPYARRALLCNPSLADGLYTLAMGLAQAGAKDEAIRLLDSYTRDDTYREHRRTHADQVETALAQLRRLLGVAAPTAVELSLS